MQTCSGVSLSYVVGNDVAEYYGDPDWVKLEVILIICVKTEEVSVSKVWFCALVDFAEVDVCEEEADSFVYF